MPCSASTAGGEAASASPASTADIVSAPSRLVSGAGRLIALTDPLVHPLVIKRPFERRQLLSEVLGMGGNHAGIEGFAVTPDFDQGEMVRVAVPLQHVKPQIGRVFAGSLRLRFDELDRRILVDREDVDVSDHKDRLGG